MITEADLPTEADLDMLADKVVERLSANVISAALPAWVGEWVREATQHGVYQWQYTIPMMRGTCMAAEFRFSPDGSFQLELRDTAGSPFWRGTFRPEATDAKS